MERTRREKLEQLNDLIIDKAIEELENGELSIKDANGIITLLKNNKVIEEEKVISESDVIDSLVEDKSKR